jgi:hypothetical protein
MGMFFGVVVLYVVWRIYLSPPIWKLRKITSETTRLCDLLSRRASASGGDDSDIDLDAAMGYVWKLSNGMNLRSKMVKNKIIFYATDGVIKSRLSPVVIEPMCAYILLSISMYHEGLKHDPSAVEKLRRDSIKAFIRATKKTV